MGYFIFFLWEQDKDDDDGLEYYVRHKIIQNEITWFPMSNAMCLDMGETEHEVMRGDMMNQIQTKESELIKRLSDLEENVNVVLDKLSGAIDRDYSSAGSIKLGIAGYLKNINEGALENQQQPVMPSMPLGSTLEQGSVHEDPSVAGGSSSGGMNQAPDPSLCAVLTSVSLPMSESSELQ